MIRDDLFPSPEVAGALSTIAAIVVLGCAPHAGAFRRRAEAGAALFADIFPKNRELRVIASGGRSWQGEVEADALFLLMAARGVPENRIVRERCSLSTKGNARFTAGILDRTGERAIALVTCDWHMPRAMALFTSAGFDVLPVGVPGPDPGYFWRAYRAVRERVAMRLDGELR